MKIFWKIFYLKEYLFYNLAPSRSTIWVEKRGIKEFIRTNRVLKKHGREKGQKYPKIDREKKLKERFLSKNRF